MPAIDVENAWGFDATSYGNHEFDYGVARLLEHQARAVFPFLGVNIIETATGQAPEWVKSSTVFDINGIKVGVIGAALENTPELVAKGDTEGLIFLRLPRRSRPSLSCCAPRTCACKSSSSTKARRLAPTAWMAMPALPWHGPIIPIAEPCKTRPLT